VEIREAIAEDWPAIWPIMRDICAAGETYPYPRDISEEFAREIWMLRPPSRTVVAVDDDGTVLGTAKMNPNQMGAGAHIASASYMVDPARFGKGSGGRSVTTRWNGRGPRATGACSSTPWWRAKPGR
jgi:hypothetical protein